MTKINPTLSIIIVSYNTSKLTSKCLFSILSDKGLTFNLQKIENSSKIPSEIIIVDNNSSDDTVESIKKLILDKPYLKDSLTLILNKKNSGFGAANNQGIKIAKGNYLLFLNSDTEILHSAISQTLNWLSSHPESSLATAQLLNTNHTIQASGGYFPNLLNLFTWSTNLDDLPLVNKLIPAIHPHTPDFYTKETTYLYDHSQDWLTGAFLMARKNIIDAVNGFNTKYFMYGEELELCFRIKQKFPHTQFWYLIGPQIIHHGQGSAKTPTSHIKAEYEGILTFFKIHRPSWQYPIAKILIKINSITHNFISNFRPQ